MSKAHSELSRREFMAGVSAAAGGLALGSLALADMNFSQPAGFTPPPPLPLKIQPVLTCGLFERREQTSWRPWGGFHTQQDIDRETQRINRELNQLTADSEFPLEIMPLITLNSTRQAARVAQGDHDVLLMYAANSWVNVLEALTNPQKWTIVFVRHKSGPVYLWYEIAHNRYLRKTVDEFGQPGVDHQDVVVDKLVEIQWRLRALSGLKNTLGKKMIAVGGPAGWGTGGQKAPDLTRKIFKMDFQTVGYTQLAELITKARNNSDLVNRCRNQAQQYLKQSGADLQTDQKFVVNAFILTEILKNIMDQAQTDALTINQCMGTIMPLAQTTACLPLSLLNDAGYTAYCESDFVVIPSGVLLHHISNKPVFLNDPTYPHEGIVTLAHCTAPRKMDGQKLEPARILTHFESDYGAAPKVEMKIGQKITVLDPDFDFKRWLGFEGEVIDNPFLDICRSQIDVKINGDCQILNAQTRGFHWMACYGNYLNEVGYALKKINIDWLNLSKS
ncbi:twin-arginine translocation signal domain-containing protein [Planctomycetota bacterium]